MNDVLVLGGYGNFGKRIAQILTRHNIPVIIAGRSAAKAQALAATLPASLVKVAVFNVKIDLPAQLALLQPKVVINTCGPFQGSDYQVAQTCIRHNVHYIDLADGRDFVTGITALNEAALGANTAIISGASTVPALTSAVIDHYLPQFTHLDALKFGISPGQRAERGLATTQAILGYVGKRLAPCAGHPVRYGWQDLYRQPYPRLGSRWMANCDIPDLDLLPAKYGITDIAFSAGMESPLIHLGIWALSWAVRLGLPLNLARHAPALLAASNLFNIIGSDDGGMHIILTGRDPNGATITRKWFIVALNGDGPYIPTIPAIILAKRLIRNEFTPRGAMACVGLVSLHDYLQELAPFHISTYET